MELVNLLIEILKKYDNKFGKQPSKTRLLKLAYLADLYHTRRFRKRLLSDVNWVYYLYGPYIFEYDKILSDGPFSLEEVESEDEKSATLVSLDEYQEEKQPELDIRLIVEKVVWDYGDMNINDLLDYIYFETEPMMDAEIRMEELSFENVMSEDFYKVRKLFLDPETEKKLRESFRKRVKQVRGN